MVGGGVGALSPFTVNRVTYISATDPPTIGAMSVAAFSTGTGGTHPALVISLTPDTDPQPGANEVLRVKGGAIFEGTLADTVQIGRNATTNSTGNVAVGTSASATSTGSLAVGNSAVASGNNGTAVGNGATANGGGGAGTATALGNAATASNVQSTALGGNSTASGIASLACGQGATANATGAIAIGSGSTVNGFAAISIGFNSPPQAANQIVIVSGGNTPTIGAGATGGLVLLSGGSSVSITHANQIWLGQNATSFVANCAGIGAGACRISTCVIGGGDTSTATLGGLTVRCTNGITTNNLAMGDLTIIAPRSTGNAANGSILLQTGVVGAAGNALQAARTGAAVKASATAADTDLLVFDVDTATLARVSVGAAGSGGVGFKVLRIPN